MGRLRVSMDRSTPEMAPSNKESGETEDEEIWSIDSGEAWLNRIRGIDINVSLCAAPRVSIWRWLHLTGAIIWRCYYY